MEILSFITSLLKGLLIFGIIILIVWVFLALALYILTSIVMEKHSREKYGKSSILVWIPIARLYYLGKELSSEYLGYGLVILRLLFIFDGIGGTKILFFSVNFIYKIIILCMFISLYSKYKELVKENEKKKKTKKEK